MKAMATDMGDTIATQNDQIDRMNVKAESNSNRIKAANQRAQNILDSWIMYHWYSDNTKLRQFNTLLIVFVWPKGFKKSNIFS